jgi:hypothetical protein
VATKGRLTMAQPPRPPAHDTGIAQRSPSRDKIRDWMTLVDGRPAPGPVPTECVRVGNILVNHVIGEPPLAQPHGAAAEEP